VISIFPIRIWRKCIADTPVTFVHVLTTLQCGDSNDATGIEQLPALTFIQLGDNQIATIDLTNNTALISLHLGGNRLTDVDVSNNTFLTGLGVRDNQLTAIDVTNNTALTVLALWNNKLTTIDVANNSELVILNVNDNELTSIDVSKNTSLTQLALVNNRLNTIDVRNNTALTALVLTQNRLTAIDVTNNTALVSLFLDDNQLTSLGVSNNTALTTLSLRENRLTAINTTNNASLVRFLLDNNQLTTVDVTYNTDLFELGLSGNELTTIDVTNNTVLVKLDLSVNPGYPCVDIQALRTKFPDLTIIDSCPATTIVSSTDFTDPFDFQDISQWTISIVEYDGSPDQLDEINFLVELDPLPANAGPGFGLRISGTNPSAHLFMYAKRQVKNLKSNTRYQMSWEIEIASNADSGCDGAEALPGESVFVVAAATDFAPSVTFSNNLLVLNIDKGNAGVAGEDALVLGDIAINRWTVQTIPMSEKVSAAAGSISR
jgi:hypothetical protein